MLIIKKNGYAIGRFICQLDQINQSTVYIRISVYSVSNEKWVYTVVDIVVIVLNVITRWLSDAIYIPSADFLITIIIIV